MPRRAVVPFFLIVIFLSIGGTFLALQLSGFLDGGPAASGDGPAKIITVPVLITTTPDPNFTPEVIILTATFNPQQLTQQVNQIQLPPDIATTVGDAAAASIATVDPSLINTAPLGLTATALPPNCILYEIKEGDTPFGIAEEFGADGFLMLEINDLTEEDATFLQIGDILIIPLEGCDYDIPPTASPTPEGPTATPTSDVTEPPTEIPSVTATTTLTPSITPSPTITLAPTDSSAQIQILEVENAGDVTAEGVRLRNQGNTVNVTGWILTDLEGNEFVFPQQLLFSNAEITIFTREGTNTPVALFWGLDEAVWEAGDILTLTDSGDNIQTTLRLPEADG